MLAASEAETVVSSDRTANLYINFADGPGVYQLVVLDRKGTPVRALFRERVVAQADTWITWDGKDDQGKDIPEGESVVLFLKDGVELKRIIVLRTVGNSP